MGPGNRTTITVGNAKPYPKDPLIASSPALDSVGGAPCEKSNVGSSVKTRYVAGIVIRTATRRTAFACRIEKCAAPWKYRSVALSSPFGRGFASFDPEGQNTRFPRRRTIAGVNVSAIRRATVTANPIVRPIVFRIGKDPRDRAAKAISTAPPLVVTLSPAQITAF